MRLNNHELLNKLIVITGKPQTLTCNISGMHSRILIRFFLLVCLQQSMRKLENGVYPPPPLALSIV